MVPNRRYPGSRHTDGSVSGHISTSTCYRPVIDLIIDLPRLRTCHYNIRELLVVGRVQAVVHGDLEIVKGWCL